MEYLTKQQIILLAFLVSFVSSIATGIVTVSLMDQAPPTVSQTINRVVERTIERATPTSGVKETIIVKEDQAVINSIAKVSKSIVRITRDGVPALLGLLISDSGKIIAYDPIGQSTNLVANLDGGNTVLLSFVSHDPASGISVYQAEQSLDPSLARVYAAAPLADSSNVKLGQSVILLSGLREPVANTGIVSSISAEKIYTNVQTASVDSSSILVNLLGEVIGVKDIPSNILKTYATP